MYIKKIEGPRIVKLPDGSTLTRADLPPPDTVRWVARRKATVVKAVKFGLITRDDAMSRYALSEEELEAWIRAIERHGMNALKATRLKTFRQP
jgi:hypothetical protein